MVCRGRYPTLVPLLPRDQGLIDVFDDDTVLMYRPV